MDRRLKRFIRAILISAICLLLLTGSIYALTYLNVISVGITITEGVTVVKVYSDSALTTEITSIGITSIEQNQAWVGNIYVRNEGMDPLNIGVMAQGNTAFGMVMFSPTGSIVLAPDESVPIEVTIYVLPDAVSGQYNFSIIIYEVGS